MDSGEFLLAFDNLNLTGNAPGNLDKMLSALQTASDDDCLGKCLEIDNNGRLPLLHSLLVQSDLSKVKLSQLIAELAKTESLRAKFVEHKYIPTLVKMLAADDVALATQACRALGNICYENDAGRDAVDADDGISHLLQLLETQLHNDKQEAKKLRVIACGFLLNLSNTHELIQQKAIDGGALGVLCDYISDQSDDEELCNMVLQTLSCLLDSDVNYDHLGSIKVTSVVMKLFISQKGSIHEDSLLDLLTVLAENDDVKEMLAASELPERLVSLITRNMGNINSANEEDGILKLTADLIVSLLRGDRSMQILFGNGDGVVFRESLKWLQSDIEHLQTAGALGVGNFARNDDHCLRLVDGGVVPRLLALLDNPQTSNITLQHACLSALRNLAIPVANKPVLVAAGVIASVMKLTNIEVLPVVFKLLGVIRMLIDGQKEAAMFVATDTVFMSQLVEWCGVDEHAGVKGESTRLLAWLIKNTNSQDVCRIIIKYEAVNHLVTMVTSEHVVMQTEALLALTLLCHHVLEEASAQLREADVVKTLCQLLKNETCQAEVLCNALAFTKALNKREPLRDEMLENCMDDIVDKLKSHANANVRDAAEDTLTALAHTDS